MNIPTEYQRRAGKHYGLQQTDKAKPTSTTPPSHPLSEEEQRCPGINGGGD